MIMLNGHMHFIIFLFVRSIVTDVHVHTAPLTEPYYLLHLFMLEQQQTDLPQKNLTALPK
jgi:hypothetical protein